MRADIKGTQSVADQLTGKQPIGSKKLQQTKSDKAKTAKPEDKNLRKFTDLMEERYKNSSIEVEIKREI